MTSEENFKSLWQYAYKFGLMYALSVIIIDLLFFITGTYRGNHQAIDLTISTISSIAIMYFGMKLRRDNDFGGYSKYLEVLKTCLAIGVIASVTVALWKYAFYSFINPEELVKEFELVKKTFLESDYFDEDKKMELIRMSKEGNTPMSKLTGNLIIVNIYSLILGLILSVFVQKQNPDDAYNQLDR
jgi:FtsH-binding integral membrane protein